jgi:catechol 2,3-dioxygenase-like lactoylglutathione lyase family enzyme
VLSTSKTRTATHSKSYSSTEGKGAAKWHRPSDNLFLGIDHTAIVVGDTEASLSFYRNVLGLRVAGESENYGTEQEHLNNVLGARLRITSLRAEGGGPGTEFLEYLAPRDGRAIPKDERANDLTHWQTKLIVRSVVSAEQFSARPEIRLHLDRRRHGQRFGFQQESSRA